SGEYNDEGPRDCHGQRPFAVFRLMLTLSVCVMECIGESTKTRPGVTTDEASVFSLVQRLESDPLRQNPCGIMTA
ncbi:MAG TPA: hypothetical protein VIO57_18090, partial [Chloroflexota bacterium]